MQYILIADDNNDITDILSVYVKKEGYATVPCGILKKCIALFRECPVHP